LVIVLALVLTSGFIRVIILIFFSIILYFIFLKTKQLFVFGDVLFSILKIIYSCIDIFFVFFLVLSLTAPLWLPVLSSTISQSVEIQGTSNPYSLITVLAPNVFNHMNVNQYVKIGDFTNTYHFHGFMLFIVLGSAFNKNCYRNILFLIALILFLLSRNVFEVSQALQKLPIIGIIIRPHLFEPILIPILFFSINTFDSVRLKLAAKKGLWIYIFLCTISIAILECNGQNYSKIGFLTSFIFVFMSLYLVTLISKRYTHKLIFLLTIVIFVFHILNGNKIWKSAVSPDSFSKTSINKGYSDLISLIKTQPQNPFRVAVDQKSLGGAWNGVYRVWEIETLNGFEPSLDYAYLLYMRDGFSDFNANRTFGDFNPNSIKFIETNTKYYLTVDGADSRFVENSNWKIVYKNYFHLYENKNFRQRYKLLSNCNISTPININKISDYHTIITIFSSCKYDRLDLSLRNYKEWLFVLNNRNVKPKLVNDIIGMEIPLHLGLNKLDIRFNTPNLGLSYAIQITAFFLILTMYLPKVKKLIFLKRS
jgi:hypothetical protein